MRPAGRPHGNTASRRPALDELADARKAIDAECPDAQGFRVVDRSANTCRMCWPMSLRPLDLSVDRPVGGGSASRSGRWSRSLCAAKTAVPSATAARSQPDRRVGQVVAALPISASRKLSIEHLLPQASIGRWRELRPSSPGSHCGSEQRGTPLFRSTLQLRCRTDLVAPSTPAMACCLGPRCSRHWAQGLPISATARDDAMVATRVARNVHPNNATSVARFIRTAQPSREQDRPDDAVVFNAKLRVPGRALRDPQARPEHIREICPVQLCIFGLLSMASAASGATTFGTASPHPTSRSWLSTT